LGNQEAFFTYTIKLIRARCILYKPLKLKTMFKKLKKERQAKATKNVKVEKLNTKELNNTVGGSQVTFPPLDGASHDGAKI